MEKKKKAGINTKLLVLIIILLMILGAAIYALSTGTSLNSVVENALRSSLGSD